INENDYRSKVTLEYVSRILERKIYFTTPPNFAKMEFPYINMAEEKEIH
ncbi:18845_t:CDS:1, partial [Racocetra fulgida]